MRKYEVYLIDKDVAKEYLGVEHKLYKIFNDYRNASSLGKFLLGKQIKYMTKDIHVFLLNNFLQYHLRNLESYTFENNTHMMDYNKGTSSLNMWVEEESVRIESRGTFLAETILFDVFEQTGENYDVIGGAYFAIDFENKRYGWIRQKITITEEKTV